MGRWTATKFRRCIEELDFRTLAGLSAGDALLHVAVGPWRYQRQGAHAMARRSPAPVVRP